MKRNMSFRLKLHRETLRVLASPELEGAQGGAILPGPPQSISCRVSCGGTCTPASCNVLCNSSVCQTIAC
ncbi:MAG TPA: hypothetical protein VIE43_13970 [Thermoanaerobaculia bacterium]|jgi:hypothetical protein|nr:hypothetical protein [Thermoanaerobaculia bacterium]